MCISIASPETLFLYASTSKLRIIKKSISAINPSPPIVAIRSHKTTVEIPIITLITAFGIAVVKAYMVAANFMHLKFEKHIVWFMMIMSLILLGVFFFGVAPDVMQTEGDQWIDCVADNSCVELRL